MTLERVRGGRCVDGTLHPLAHALPLLVARLARPCEILERRDVRAKRQACAILTQRAAVLVQALAPLSEVTGVEVELLALVGELLDRDAARRPHLPQRIGSDRRLELAQPAVEQVDRV